jgi:hypothetical protein
MTTGIMLGALIGVFSVIALDIGAIVRCLRRIAEALERKNG